MDMPRSSREQSARPTRPPARARIPASTTRRFWHSIAAPAKSAPWAYIPPPAAAGTRKSSRCGAPPPASIAQIHRHQTESAALNQQVGRFERVLGIVAAADPEHAIESHAGGFGGRGVERVFCIHQCARFLPRVASARIEISRLVRPEEAGPKISVRLPRGNPPMAPSISAMPVGTVSGAGRDCQSRRPPNSDSNCFLRTAAVICSPFVRRT